MQPKPWQPDSWIPYYGNRRVQPPESRVKPTLLAKLISSPLYLDNQQLPPPPPPPPLKKKLATANTITAAVENSSKNEPTLPTYTQPKDNRRNRPERLGHHPTPSSQIRGLGAEMPDLQRLLPHPRHDGLLSHFLL